MTSFCITILYMYLHCSSNIDKVVDESIRDRL